MTDWVRKGERVTRVRFTRGFAWDLDDPLSGFGFPCDEAGNLLDPNVASWENYQACVSGVVDGRTIHDVGVQRWENSYWEPGVLRCAVCHEEVVVDRLMTNTCDRCGADYNSAGQRLAPREQWGWDTGESVSDILSADRQLV